MRSGTSFFDLTIYRKTVNRFWPLWAVNLVIWLFILPFDGLIVLSHNLEAVVEGEAMFRWAQRVGDWATEWGVIYALIAGLIVAMAVCSHLYNNRSANFMGALPCRREGQFLSTYLAGLTILIGPNLLIFLLTLLVEAAGGCVVWGSLLFWMGALCGMEFFFYSFAVCLGQFAGHILALPVFYGVFNAIVAAFYGLLGWVLDVYYFGFDGSLYGSEKIVTWCTPVVSFLQMDIDYIEENGVPMCDVEGLWVVGVYAVAALVLAACALLLYRRRHLETAGDIVAVKAMRPVFKYGVALCVGLFFGFVMDQMFGLGELGMLVAIILWGIVGYFVAQMLLDKTIRVFKKWKGAVAVVVVFLVMFLVIGFDLTGYETRVPSASNVTSVEISGLHGAPVYGSGSSLSEVVLNDPADIEAVVALHQGIVDQGEDGETGDHSVPEDYFNQFVSFRVAYTLKGGGTMSRRYSVVMTGELRGKAQALRDRYNVRYQACQLDEIADWQIQGYDLYAVEYDYVDENDQSFEVRVDTPADMERLLTAVMEDFQAGRIGTHTLTGATKVPAFQPSNLEFQWGLRVSDGMRFRSILFYVEPQATSTWQVLNQLLSELPEKTAEG